MIHLPWNKNSYLLMLICITLMACKNEDQITQKKYPTPYTLSIPRFFPKPYLSSENPLTEEGIRLGSLLYKDQILSTNGRACVSCHVQEKSFSIPLYHTRNGATVSVPPHVNLAFKNKFNWIGSEHSLDTLAMGDFEPEFFNTDSILLKEKLIIHTLYPTLFKQAFGIANLNDLPYHELKKTIAKALAQFLRTKVSANSKFDKFMRKEALLNQDEFEGYTLFFSEKGDCFHCHSYPLLSDQEFHNNGLNSSYQGFDKGKYLISNIPEDLGKFISPTLRNIELTAPYMHDGRFKTLEDVINHYSEGVSDEANVDPIFNKHDGRKLNLTPLQKQQLIAFLKTLTDWEYVK